MTEEAVLAAAPPATEAPLKRKPDEVSDEITAGIKKPRPVDADPAPDTDGVHGNPKHGDLKPLSEVGGGASAAPPEELEAYAGTGEVLQEAAPSAMEGVVKKPEASVEADAANAEGDEELSEIDSEDDQEGEESDDDDEEGSDEDVSRTPKGKELASDSKGKGKAKVKEGSDAEDNEEDDDGYLSEDPLEEVDLNNILPTRTRRRNADTRYDPAELGAEEADEDDDSDADV